MHSGTCSSADRGTISIPGCTSYFLLPLSAALVLMWLLCDHLLFTHAERGSSDQSGCSHSTQDPRCAVWVLHCIVGPSPLSSCPVCGDMDSPMSPCGEGVSGELFLAPDLPGMVVSLCWGSAIQFGTWSQVGWWGGGVVIKGWKGGS